ncbi:MAG TPA: hypothetical protein VK809_01885, partial [Bacteroidia bacterium]|nr:hypothetical protein [Bacteroidia bacterium]
KIINPAEVGEHIHDENSSFFAFNCSVSCLSGSSDGGHSSVVKSSETDYLLIDSNAVPTERRKNHDDYFLTQYEYNFGIFLGDNGTKYNADGNFSPYMLVQKTHLMDKIWLASSAMYGADITRMCSSNINPSTRLFFNQSIGTTENKTVSEIPFYVICLEKQLEYILDHGNEPKTQTVKSKVLYSVPSRSTDDDETAKVTGYDNGLETLKSYTLLVDSNFCDKIGRRILSKSLGINEGQIKQVNRQDILDAVDKQTPKTALFFCRDISRFNDFMTTIYSTNGTCLASVDFSVTHSMLSSKRWGFSFQRLATFGINRSDIVIK